MWQIATWRLIRWQNSYISPVAAGLRNLSQSSDSVPEWPHPSAKLSTFLTIGYSIFYRCLFMICFIADLAITLNVGMEPQGLLNIYRALLITGPVCIFCVRLFEANRDIHNAHSCFACPPASTQLHHTVLYWLQMHTTVLRSSTRSYRRSDHWHRKLERLLSSQQHGVLVGFCIWTLYNKFTAAGVARIKTRPGLFWCHAKWIDGRTDHKSFMLLCVSV